MNRSSTGPAAGTHAFHTNRGDYCFVLIMKMWGFTSWEERKRNSEADKKGRHTSLSPSSWFCPATFICQVILFIYLFIYLLLEELASVIVKTKIRHMGIWCGSARAVRYPAAFTPAQRGRQVPGEEKHLRILQRGFSEQPRIFFFFFFFF